VKTGSDPARVGRLVVALCGRALALTPDGGRLVLRAETRAREAAVVAEHTRGDPADALGYETEVLAAGAVALGGSFERAPGEHRTERLVLTLPRNERS
jgi:hypothetical protein